METVKYCMLGSFFIAFLFVVIFFDAIARESLGIARTILNDGLVLLDDAGIQRVVLVGLMVYFVVFRVLRNIQYRFYDPTCWLSFGLAIAGSSFVFSFSPSFHILSLFLGVIIGQGVAWICEAAMVGVRCQNLSPLDRARIQFPTSSFCRQHGRNMHMIVLLLVALLCAAVAWSANEGGGFFEYQGHSRWVGPWNNPNIFGIFMGVGVVLSSGVALSLWKIEDGESIIRYNANWRSLRAFVKGGFCLIALVLMGRGLLHSYSRGAWLATTCALIYMLSVRLSAQSFWSRQNTRASTINYQLSFIARFFQKNGLPLAVIVVVMGVLCLLHFRQTGWHPAQRALSVVNPADFSSRNRVAAWIGDLQMIAEHPLFGAGWDRPEALYEHYYMPPRLIDGAAIQLNDYLVLGATLGIPALFCFGIYLWLSLGGKAESGKQTTEAREMDWLWITCRAGAIVLLVGFWFDGGLFKLATTSTFWILLEIGNVQTANTLELTRTENSNG